MNFEQGEKLRLIAEQAAEWLHLLPAATPEQRARFLAWLVTSPLHVRELLAAFIIDDELRSLDPERLINVDELAVKAKNNVISITRHRHL